MEDHELEDFRRRSSGSPNLLPLRAHLIFWNRVGIAGFSSALILGTTLAFLPAGPVASVLYAVLAVAIAALSAGFFKIMSFVCPNCNRLYSFAPIKKRVKNNGRQCVRCGFDLYNA